MTHSKSSYGSELQNKHREKKQLKKEIKQIGVEVNSVLGIMLYSSLIYQINIAVSSRRVAISVRHKKKIEKFRGRQHKQEQPYAEMKFNKHIVHNYSTYSLSNEQYIALSYGLDTHIPSRTNANMIYTEFEVFFQGLLKDTGNIPETELQLIKTKLRNTCEKYTKIKVPYKYRENINELIKREYIAVVKAYKGRGVVIMNRDKYHKKCLELLDTEQFQKLNHDPTKTTERKVQNTLCKIKSKLSINEYKRIYPTGSSPGKLDGTAKIHKLSDRDGIQILPIRQTISNLNTGTYYLAKYLAKLLSTSEYTVSSSKEFMAAAKNVQMPSGYHMVSFDVKSLFTNVPLEYTIGLVLERIYKGELVTNIARSEMKEMLLLYTKKFCFSYNQDTCI